MAWHKVLALGLVASGVVFGCTVTTSDKTGDGGVSGDGAATGGATGDGASTGGQGGSTGGQGGSTGGASTGGGTSEGGTLQCNPAAETDPCEKCVQTKCCDPWKACGANATCTGTDGEYIKTITCLQNGYADAGTLTKSDVEACIGGSAAAGLPEIETQDLITCITGTGQGDGGTADAGSADCAVECFHTDIQ